MARRRVRPPGTQLARAGERTPLVTIDRPVPAIRFRATVLDGAPQGWVHVDRLDGPETLDLGPEMRIDGEGLVAISLVPKTDTAITFLPVDRRSSPAFLILGGVILLGAVGWTVWDFFGLGA